MAKKYRGIEQEVSHQRRKDRIMTIVLAVAVCAILVLGAITSDRNREARTVIYDAAMSAMESGEYVAAARKFMFLGDWRDSKAKAEECLDKLEIIQNDHYTEHGGGRDVVG